MVDDTEQSQADLIRPEDWPDVLKRLHKGAFKAPGEGQDGHAVQPGPKPLVEEHEWLSPLLQGAGMAISAAIPFRALKNKRIELGNVLEGIKGGQPGLKAIQQELSVAMKAKPSDDSAISGLRNQMLEMQKHADKLANHAVSIPTKTTAATATWGAGTLPWAIDYSYPREGDPRKEAASDTLMSWGPAAGRFATQITEGLGAAALGAAAPLPKGDYEAVKGTTKTLAPKYKEEPGVLGVMLESMRKRKK